MKRRICTWCKKDMGEAPESDIGLDTHGICENCFKKQKKNWMSWKEK